jgi:ABC-2 type transport system ATP-binding protein
MPIIQTENLSVYYERQRGVHELALSVEAGEVYGFLGPNGAGKTTTLRVLMDIIRPTAGCARVFGLDCQEHGVQIRRRVGYLPGELKLYPEMRADSYFQMINAIRGGQKIQPRIADYCKRLNLDPTRPMGTYSQGNKQKVGLVAAFMGQPDLLILDEPTTGLDPLVQQVVLELVREARAAGRTVFFSSHILSEVQAVCDRVGIIRSGQIITTERVEDLVQRQFHHLRLRFETMPPAGAFEAVGAHEIERTGQELTLEIHENLNEVLSLGVQYGINDLDDQPFTLEEIFLTYYGENEDGHHG